MTERRPGLWRGLRQRPLAIALGVGLIATALPAATALADAGLAADYQLLSTQDLADGSTRATIAFTFTNTGDVAFDDLFVEWLMAVPFSLFAAPAPIAVGALAPGESITVATALDVLLPVPSDVALAFVGQGEDGGLIVPVDTAREGATP